jgi:putative transcriptional regulator
MADPRFSEAVVYMVKHDASGAMGLIVNRSFEEVSIASLLERLGQDSRGVRGSLPMRYGGPVGPGSLLVLHTSDYRSEETKVIAGGIALTSSPAILRAIGSGGGPRKALLLLSYSGWGPGQLEQEIRAGAWIVAAADPRLVFDTVDETKWKRAMAAQESEL